MAEDREIEEYNLKYLAEKITDESIKSCLPCLVEPLDGPDKDRVLLVKGVGQKFKYAPTCNQFNQIIDVLHCAHDAGMYHRDARLVNCYWREDNGSSLFYFFIVIVPVQFKVHIMDDWRYACLLQVSWSMIGVLLLLIPLARTRDALKRVAP